MAHKMKEDEKIERAIRGLLKLPENRRCINCNGMGPQYVCTTFWTFICTNCSGIHREFTHRVKSVSMAKFTLDEVSALQASGNERARQIYFKNWDPHRNSQPDGSNLYKLRDFIKHVYVDRKFTGEKLTEKLPRLRLTDKEESSKIRRPYWSRMGMSGSPSHEDRHDRGYNSARSSPSARSDDGISRYYYNDSRSPRYMQYTSRGYRRSPARFEVVDDRFRDDRGMRSGHVPRLTSEDFKVVGRRSLDEPQKNAEEPRSSLESRLERELSWQSSQPARSRERDEGKEAEVSSSGQKVPTPPGQGSSTNDNRAKQEKVADQGSLIDCNDDSKPHDVQSQQTPPPATLAAATTSAAAAATTTADAAAAKNDGTNWGPFGSSNEEKKAPNKPSDPNTLEFLLFQLASPAPLPAPSSNEVSSGADQPTNEQHVLPTTEQHVTPATEQKVMPTTKQNTVNAQTRLPEPESVEPPMTEPHPDTSIQQPLEETAGDLDNDANSTRFLIPQQHHQPPISAPAENMPIGEQPLPTAPAPSVGTVTQQQPTSYPDPAQNVAKTEPESNFSVASQSPQLERRPSGRRELPADLFTTLCSQAPAPVRAWQSSPPQGFGFNMHCHPPNMMQLTAYSNSPKSTNPFDVGAEGTEPQGLSLPPVMSMQGPPFNNFVSAPPSPFSLVQQSSYMPPTQPQSPPHGQAFSPGFYMGQQHGQSSIPFPSVQQPQEYGGFAGNPNHQMMISYPGPPTSNYSYSSSVGGGNPFG